MRVAGKIFRSKSRKFCSGSAFLPQLLRKGGTRLMEPFMKLEVTIEDRYLHAVLGDLAQHRSDIIEVTERHELKVDAFFFITSSIGSK